jgi:hypothetical protein
MRSLVLIRDVRRQLQLPLPPANPPTTTTTTITTTPSASAASSTALAIDPVHGTGFILLAWEGQLLACDPEDGGTVVWTADLNAAVAADEQEEEEEGEGSGGMVRPALCFWFWFLLEMGGFVHGPMAERKRERVSTLCDFLGLFWY